MYMCMHMCVCTHFLGAYICDMYLRAVCVSVNVLLLFIITSLCHPHHLCHRMTVCKLVYLLWLNISSALSPSHWPLRGCPHLQAVTEGAWCVGMSRGGPGYIQTGTSCVGQHRRWQPIWGCEEKREKMLRTGAEGRVEVKENKQEAKKETNRL